MGDSQKGQGPPPVRPPRSRALSMATSRKEKEETEKRIPTADMWKTFSNLSLSENSQLKEKAISSQAKLPIPGFIPSKYSREEAILIIQRAMRFKLAKRKLQKKNKNQRTRMNIAKEMVDTETTYVSTLETIVLNLLLPLRALNSQAKGVIDDEEIKTIFSSVEVILGFSSHLLQRLKDRYEEWQSLPPGKQVLADIFLEMTSYTKVYVSYVSNFENASSLCSQLRKKNERFERWEHEALAQIGGNHSSMSFLLITPVQRIPRYLMLVEQLLKSTTGLESGHEDVAPLSKAVESIRETASLVDKRTAETERTQKISEIEESISGKFETLREAKRRYVMEGELDIVTEGKQGKNVKNARYFFLFNDLVVICKYAKMGSLRGSLKGSLKSKGKKQPKGGFLFEFRSRSFLSTDEKVGNIVERDDVEGASNVFELNLPSAKFLLSAGSENTKKKWIDELGACLTDLEPKVQFKQDVAKKMSSEKAKRAKALIHQQYAHLRVAEQRGGGSEVSSDTEADGDSPGATPTTTTQRRFRAHRDNMSDMKKMENAQFAEQNIKALLEEEQCIKKEKEKEKEEKALERKMALEEMTNRYRGGSGKPTLKVDDLEDSPSSADHRRAFKKKKRTLRHEDFSGDSYLGTDDTSSPRTPSPTKRNSTDGNASPLTTREEKEEKQPQKRAFRRLADGVAEGEKEEKQPQKRAFRRLADEGSPRL